MYCMYQHRATYYLAMECEYSSWWLLVKEALLGHQCGVHLVQLRVVHVYMCAPALAVPLPCWGGQGQWAFGLDWIGLLSLVL